jgi:hypothetical protein
VLNVVSGKTFIERGAESLRLAPAKAADRLDDHVRELTGFRLDKRLHNLTRIHIYGERDGQAIFDALGAQEPEVNISSTSRTVIRSS